MYCTVPLVIYEMVKRHLPFIYSFEDRRVISMDEVFASFVLLFGRLRMISGSGLDVCNLGPLSLSIRRRGGTFKAQFLTSHFPVKHNFVFIVTVYIWPICKSMELISNALTMVTCLNSLKALDKSFYAQFVTEFTLAV